MVSFSSSSSSSSARPSPSAENNTAAAFLASLSPSMDIEHDFVEVDEFEALAIEIGGSSTCLPVEPAAEVELYPAKVHARKVAEAMGVTKGLIYLPGQVTTTYEHSDMSPAFRQRRYFYYLSGVDLPGAHLVYNIAKQNLTLFVPTRHPREELYMGRIPSPEVCRRRYNVDDCRSAHRLPRFLASILNEAPNLTLYVLDREQLPPQLDRIGASAITRFPAVVDACRLRHAMDQARLVKTPYEIRQIRRANRVSSAAHRAVLERLRDLKNEAHVEAVFVGNCRAMGARRQAYAPIAGAGDNAATLHYDSNDAPLAGCQTLVLDAGAEWDCYASDVTRTLPAVGGRFSEEAAAIYAVVDKMQRACIEKVRPGTPYLALQAHAQVVASTELLRLGILAGAAAEIITSGVVAAFFPHGLGHHVGLEVHDVKSNELLGHGSAEDKAAARRIMISRDYCANVARWNSGGMFHGHMTVGGSKLLEGMVVTIEPGIYFNRAYVKAFCDDHPKFAGLINQHVLEKYYHVGGVRIEDCILVTKDGYENLTTAPKGEEALRIINGGR